MGEIFTHVISFTAQNDLGSAYLKRIVLYIFFYTAKSMKQKLSGAAEARELFPPISIISRSLTDIKLGRAHNPEGNGSKPFSATISFAFLPPLITNLFCASNLDFYFAFYHC